jgi:hypothetical protein
MLLFENKVTTNKEAFIEKVKTISKKLGIDPDWLMAAMWLESGIKSDAVNEIGCVGLIQFCPITYSDTWGLTQSYLKNMSNVDQLDYVYKYLVAQNKTFNNSGKIKSYSDLHALIFFPKAVQFKNKQILEYGNLSAEQVAKANKAIDLNKDLQITRKEFEEYAKSKFASSGLTKNEQNKLFEQGLYNDKLILYICGIVVISIIGYTTFKIIKN